MSVSTITLQDVFVRSAKLFADRIALVDSHGRFTYREIDERARRIAGALVASGVRKGDRIAVLSEPRREFVEMYIAAAYAGFTLVALNTRLHPRELAACVTTAKPQRLFASRSLASLLPGRVTHLEDLEEGAPITPNREVGAEDIHNILFTSGTTGVPKGAMISQRAAATRALRLAQWFRLTPEDGFIGWLPLFHCGGDESLYATWLTGGRYCVFGKPDPLEMFEKIQSDKLSWTLLLPGVLTSFLHHPRRREFDLRSMRFAIGYANMMPQVIEELCSTLNISFFDAFGQTETSYVLAHVEVKPGEVPSLRKQPTPFVDIRLVDAEMNDVPLGTPGECVARGPSMMSGYLDDAQATAEAFRGGWLHTGDVLVGNEDGTLTFVDRSKYLIKTGGENVYPAEVELVLASHPAVQEACVFGIPDPHWGEAIKAVIVLRPGHSATPDELIAHCREQLAGYKRPRQVELVAAAEIPRSTTGKILRGELAARYGTSA
ncbi:MAG TPA: AMP-binding protein [Kofleriaceae bacterium]